MRRLRAVVGVSREEREEGGEVLSVSEEGSRRCIMRGSERLRGSSLKENREEQREGVSSPSELLVGEWVLLNE